MNQKLTMKEIEKRYDSQWVLLGDPETDKYDRIKRAVVLAHSLDKNRVYRIAMKLKPKSSAVFWIGEPPDVIAIGYDLLIERNRQTIITASGLESAPEDRVSRILALGRERLDFPLLCYDLPRILQVDGLLGLDFMRRYRLVVDFPNGFLSLR